MKKKLLAIALALTLVFAFAACGDSEGFSNKDVEEKLEAAGFEIITSVPTGAGFIKGTLTVETPDGESVIITLYKKESNVPAVTVGSIKSYKNAHITASTVEAADAVIEALKA